MSKAIEVYNACFGDCIILKEDDCSLLIDFGIHYNSVVPPKYRDRNYLMKCIAEDIANRYSKGSIDLLITHFHEDHVSGLVYMLQDGNIKFKELFRRIYIANIWDNPFIVASNLLEKMLLEEELRKNKLPRTTASLFDVLLFIASNVDSVVLLSRGVKFENERFITLWPDKEEKKDENADEEADEKADEKEDEKADGISDIIKDLALPTGFEGELMALSEMVCIFVNLELMGKQYFMSENIDRKGEPIEGVSKIRQIEDLKKLYNSLLAKIEDSVDLREHVFNDYKLRLNKLNHKSMVVFQNTDYDNENVLFTGDIEAIDMNMIAKKNDIKLHSNFKYIKIPHHGTENHFFDFSKYSPEVVIITNGPVNVAKSNKYKIYSEYGALKADHVCTNSTNCAFTCQSNAIGCNGRRIVCSSLFVTV